MAAKPKKADKSQFSMMAVSKITQAKDNNHLYGHFAIDNVDDADLVRSIEKHGIREPLVLSYDHILISGHRRVAAAKYLGLKRVPVQVLESSYHDFTGAEIKNLLRLYNQQREKTPEEKINEELLSIDKDAAYGELRQRRVKKIHHEARQKSNVQMGGIKKRAGITTLQFLNAAKVVIEENYEYWPLTVRRIHYLLLNNPPLRHDKKPDSRYENTPQSYKALTNLLIRARLAGVVEMEAIEDSTRPIQLGGGFSTFQAFVRQSTEDFLLGYSRNLMQGQPQHIEIMLEKNALRTIIEAVARDYCIPVTTGRGFSSLSPRYDIFQRYRNSGKGRLALLMLTDFDPDGDEIAASFARSMRDDFGVFDILPVKVALTAEDVAAYDLPSDMDAKPSSTNYKKFVKRYGATKVVELDAAPVDLLQRKLREAIEKTIDVEAFNAQVELEKEDAAHIAAHRKVVLDAIGKAT